MSKDLQEQFILSAPIASLEDLPAALKDAPIDRPALLEHLGKPRFVKGKVSKIFAPHTSSSNRSSGAAVLQGFKRLQLYQKRGDCCS